MPCCHLGAGYTDVHLLFFILETVDVYVRDYFIFVVLFIMKV
jgi:hypothetical protein